MYENKQNIHMFVKMTPLDITGIGIRNKECNEQKEASRRGLR